MCELCDTADELILIGKARTVADALLFDVFHFPMLKAIDISDAKGFDRAIARLAAELGGKSKPIDTQALRTAISILDIDWSKTTAAERNRLISRALEAAGKITAKVPKEVSASFGSAAEEVVRSTRDHARDTHRLNIAADFNAVDRKIVEHLKSSQTAFIKDEYGNRLEKLEAESRRVVAQGLEAGLGRGDIAENIEQAAKSALVERSPFYWEVIAGSMIANGRSFSQMSSYAEAGIERYIIEAVLDERTTEICRFLHGKRFSVESALSRFDRIQEMDSPEDIKMEQPWVRESIDPDTGRKTLFVERGSKRIDITDVIRSAFGTRDERGEFSRSLPEKDLMNLGIGFPPYHGLCRTTTVPDIA